MNCQKHFGVKWTGLVWDAVEWPHGKARETKLAGVLCLTLLNLMSKFGWGLNLRHPRLSIMKVSPSSIVSSRGWKRRRKKHTKEIADSQNIFGVPVTTSPLKSLLSAVCRKDNFRYTRLWNISETIQWHQTLRETSPRQTLPHWTLEATQVSLCAFTPPQSLQRQKCRHSPEFQQRLSKVTHQQQPS